MDDEILSREIITFGVHGLVTDIGAIKLVVLSFLFSSFLFFSFKMRMLLEENYSEKRCDSLVGQRALFLRIYVSNLAEGLFISRYCTLGITA